MRHTQDGPPAWKFLLVGIGMVIFFWIVAANLGWAQTTVTEAIQQDTDDCGYISSFATDQSYFFLGNYGGQANSMGLRFQTVAIPQGSTISSATVAIITDDTWADDIEVVCYAEDTADATTFSDETDFNNRTKTTASDATSWTTNVVAGDSVYLDCTDAVQEVINRGDWASGNDMVIIADDNGSGYNEAISFHDYAYTNRIHSISITYTEAASGEASTTVVRGSVIKESVIK